MFKAFNELDQMYFFFYNVLICYLNAIGRSFLLKSMFPHSSPHPLSILLIYPSQAVCLPPGLRGLSSICTKGKLDFKLGSLSLSLSHFLKIKYQEVGHLKKLYKSRF